MSIDSELAEERADKIIKKLHTKYAYIIIFLIGVITVLTTFALHQKQIILELTK